MNGDEDGGTAFDGPREEEEDEGELKRVLRERRCAARAVGPMSLM
jgi:hypothetical protein